MPRKPNTTELAFEKLLLRPDQWRRTGRPMAQRLNYLDKLQKGLGITLNQKEKILLEAGARVKQEKVWIDPP